MTTTRCDDATTTTLKMHVRNTHSPSMYFFASMPNSVPLRTCRRNSSPVLTCRNWGKSSNILPDIVPFPPPGLPRMRSECEDDNNADDDDEHRRGTAMDASDRLVVPEEEAL